jgi:hypothetical protein
LHRPEVKVMEKRVWVDSGVVEELDQRQVRLLEMVYDKIVFYYAKLYQTRPCYQYPLSLSRLMKLCNRGSQAISLALRYLANTVPEGSRAQPVIFYDRLASAKNRSHRPYRIFLRKKTSDP